MARRKARVTYRQIGFPIYANALNGTADDAASSTPPPSEHLLWAYLWLRSSLNLNHGETSRTECDQEEGRGEEEEEEEDRHQGQTEEGAKSWCRRGGG